MLSHVKHASNHNTCQFAKSSPYSACALLLLYVYRRRINRRNKSLDETLPKQKSVPWRVHWIRLSKSFAQKMLRVSKVICTISSILFCLFFVSLYAGDDFINESLFRHFVKCHANHVNRARILIGLKSTTHVCQSFTRQVRFYQHEKVDEKVGENRDKFYLSPTVCQHV